MLERHGFPPQAIEDCDEPTRAKGGGDGLRGSDKQQSDLRDAGKGAYNQPPNGGDAAESTPHQDAQWGADVRGQPTMVQREDDTPKGLRRERNGPYDPRKGLKRPSARMNS